MQNNASKVIYILTIRLDEASQSYFNHLRDRHFPSERNYLKAHLTLFHQLPDTGHTFEILRNIAKNQFDMEVVGLMHLGAGVAFKIMSTALQELHAHLSQIFAAVLIPQDKQGFRPHITVQNKVTPAASKELLSQLEKTFEPFTVRATGLDLWIYQGGPWQHQETFDFL